MLDFATLPHLAIEGGTLHVRPWPPNLTLPFGLTTTQDGARGPARLWATVRATFAQTGQPFVDPRTRAELPPLPAPPLLRTEAALLANWRLSGQCGLAVGLDHDGRLHLAHAASAETGARGALVAADSAAEHLWQHTFQAAGLAERITVVTPGQGVAPEVDLLLVDSPELQPWPRLERTLERSAAKARLGFPGGLDAAAAARWARGLGPVLGCIAAQQAPRLVQLRVPMPNAARETYGDAWHRFLCAYDRFAALQPGAGFGTFVQQARLDPEQRPALLAWHEALAAAGFHAHKATLVGELLRRHRGERILVFTPDRQSAYALARAHLIAPVTAELPQTERSGALAAFAAGRLRVLAGPRLLDLGVPDGTAEVGILVGGGFGSAQRAARLRRIAPHGLVYELVSHDTLEVGRAARWRTAAGTPAGLDRGGR
jgi:hypothetical protein